MGNGGSMFFGGGLMWIIWILIIVAVVFALKTMMGNGSSGPGTKGESPLEILQRRYASGEITEEQFIKQRKEIENK